MGSVNLEKTMTPKKKLIVACVALAALLTMAIFRGASAAVAARAVLAAAALGGIGWWWLRNQKFSPAKKFQMAPRLSVISRAGLSQRTGLALVEVDGRSFLVVHGDGYAEICSTRDRERRAQKARRATDSLPKLSPEPLR
jgi:flagellar protein FliO/FliZ